MPLNNKQSYVNKFNKDGFTFKKARIRRYPAEAMKNADYADNITLFAKTPALADSLLHSLENATGDISLNVNVRKIVNMCFKPK